MSQIGQRQVTHYDECDREYTAALTAATTLDALKNLLRKWEPVAGDAFDVVMQMSETDFKTFRRGLRKERQKDFAGPTWAKRFLNVMMPEMVFRTSLLAEEFKVPWGLASNRALEVRRFTKKNGRYYDALVAERGSSERKDSG